MIQTTEKCIHCGGDTKITHGEWWGDSPIHLKDCLECGPGVVIIDYDCEKCKEANASNPLLEAEWLERVGCRKMPVFYEGRPGYTGYMLNVDQQGVMCVTVMFKGAAFIGVFLRMDRVEPKLTHIQTIADLIKLWWGLTGETLGLEMEKSDV